jgi:glycerol transport system ATP-binding protein
VARIELSGIRHVYTKGQSRTEALKGIDLEFANGCAGALLGPSGCGKTTLLNLLSGLLVPTEGRILFDGVDVTDTSPEERNIAQLFQFPVVYDSMSVYGNLAFPLKNRGVEKKQIDRRVRLVAELLELTECLEARPREIGPGERQLVALGRGIVREDTAVILLDEPMTQIDLHQRWKLRRELNRVQRELGITMIYVTHDQYEALTFAESVVVMKDGRVVQQGDAEALYERPVSPFVGYFIGTPGMNLYEVEVTGEELDFGGFTVPLEERWKEALAGRSGKLEFGIRPEHVECSEKAREGWVEGELKLVEHMGEYMVLTIEAGARTVKAKRELDMERYRKGTAVWFSFRERPERVMLYEDGKNAT